MKVFYLLLSITLLQGFQKSYSEEYKQIASNSQECLPEIELDFDKVLNFDELEEEMVKMNIIDSIKPIPPHPIIVWIRIIGVPIANSYFAVRRVIRNSVHKIAAFFKLKTQNKQHEELPIN